MKLGVNIDHVATLRQARGGATPDPVQAAEICKKAGANSIVMHLREDRRHIQDADLFRVRQAVSIRQNLEMSIEPGIVRVAARLRPEQATLVPEKRAERTTEGGLDVFRRQKLLHACLDTLRRKGITISLFVDPDLRILDECRRLGVDAVELHTGDYANATASRQIQNELKRLRRAVQHARALGLTTHAGHGLDYHNVKAIRQIQGIEELNIGYSIVTHALWVGLDRAVREMINLVR